MDALDRRRISIGGRPAEADQLGVVPPFGLVQPPRQTTGGVRAVDLPPQDAANLVVRRRQRDREGFARVIAGQPPRDDLRGDEVLPDIVAGLDGRAPVLDDAAAYLDLLRPKEAEQPVGDESDGIVLPLSVVGEDRIAPPLEFIVERVKQQKIGVVLLR